MWIYRYELTLNQGNTFMMPFIGARAGVWREMLSPHYVGLDAVPAMVASYRKIMGFDGEGGYTWTNDQFITSHAILASRMCTLPEDHRLWKELNVKAELFDDSATCWHGSGVYEDCNNKLWLRNMMIRSVLSFLQLCNILRNYL